MRALALLLLVAAACDGTTTAAERGRELFGDPGLAGSLFNHFSCATCHPTSGVAEAPRIGPSLADSAFRASWWGGYAPTLLDAVNQCLTLFMHAPLPLTAGDERGRALYEYLVSISPGGPQPALPLTVVENVTTVPLGDPARGEEVYGQVCRRCHGDPHIGRHRLFDLVSIIPEASIWFAAQNHFDPSLVMVEKVRHGQSFDLGGSMPFFSRQALSDADLGAVLAYLGGCADPTPVSDDGRPATLAYLVPALLRPSCATSGCHSELSAAGRLVLDGDAATVRAALESQVNSGMPECSPLVHRLTGDHGGRMPADQPWPAANIDLVRRWIAAGLP